MANGRTDWRATPKSITATVVEKIAVREGVDSTELRPLYEVVDPEALDAVFAPSGSRNGDVGGRITFSYCGYEVVVHGDGQVHVRNDGEN